MKLERELNIAEFRDTYARGIVNLYYTANWVLSKENLFMKKWDITQKQYNILRVLRRTHPVPVSQKELRKKIVDRMSDIPRLIERMKRKNLICTRQNESDKRFSEVLISEKGLALLKEIESIPTQQWGLGIYNLKESEMKTLNILLDKIRML